MPNSPLQMATISKRILAIGLCLSVLGLVLLLLAGPGHRLGLFNFKMALPVFRIGAYLSMFSLVFNIVGFIRARNSLTGSLRMYSALAILVSGIIMACALIFQMRAGSVPRIHDITTDTILPPGFKAVLPLRTDASNPLIYGGSFIAEQQKKAYPDIKPLDLPIPFGAAYEMALLIAKDRGWQIVGTDPANGSIEAVDTTFWFGFKDDISIRITPLGTDARVDVRSVSRVGLSDIGTNAKRIRAFLSQLKTFAEKHPLKKT